MGLLIKGGLPVKNILIACNGISKIAASSRINIWLPIVDAFRTFAVCPPPAVKIAFEQMQRLTAA